MPLWITTTSAKGNERVQALVLLDQLTQVSQKKGNDITVCEADKGYDSAELRMEMLRRECLPINRLSKKPKEARANRGNIRLFWSVKKTVVG